ncbi:MAG: MotA/TolQ/ExbB proton channel family protein [Coriobacteriales bacterium]|jgi:biopolymer transport protein ExbB/TolQ
METFELYIKDILHLVSQDLMIPAIVILLFLVGYSLWCIGSILVEMFTERKQLKAKIPELMDTIDSTPVDEFDNVIDESGLLVRQKNCLKELVKHKQLPEDSLVALAKRLLADEQEHYDKITERNDMATRVAPMFGLMGTLIPLGPGIVALGQNEVETLSASLLVAFDTTVAGLISAAICLIISKIRKRWYENYMITLESVMTGMLEKILESSDTFRASQSVFARDDIEREEAYRRERVREVAEREASQDSSQDDVGESDDVGVIDTASSGSSSEDSDSLETGGSLEIEGA